MPSDFNLQAVPSISFAMVEFQRQLSEIGNALNAILDPPASSEVLFGALQDLEYFLTRVGQDPSASMREALQPSIGALITPVLLRHLNMDVKIAVANCISELTRIMVPDTPYEDEVMKEYFHLAVLALGRLSSRNDRCYSKAVSILFTLGTVRSCVVMLDLEMDALVLEMFRQLLSSIQSNPTDSLFPHMEKVMAVLIDEHDDVPMDLLNILLISLKKDNEAVSPFSALLGARVLQTCETRIRPYLARAVKNMGSSFSDYAGVVASICQDATTQGETMVVKELESSATCHTEVGQFLVGPCASMENKSTRQDVEHDISKKQKGNQTYQSLIIDDAPGEKDNRLSTDTNSIREQTCGHTKVGNAINLMTISQVINVHATKYVPDLNDRAAERKPNPLFKPEGGCDHTWTTEENQYSEVHVGNNFERKSDCLFKRTLSYSAHMPSSMKEAHDINASASENHSFPDESYCRKGALKKKGYIVAQDDPEQKEVSFSTEIADKNQNRGKITVPENSEEELAIQALIELKACSHLSHKPLIPDVHLGKAPTSQNKRKSYSSIEKASSMTFLLKDSGENLIGHKIRVWWPMDQKFYEGYIASFDHSTKKHKVIYDDSDVEILNLMDERWHFVEDTVVSYRQDLLQGSSTSSHMLYSISPSRKKQKALVAAGTERVSSPNHKSSKTIKCRTKLQGANTASASKASRKRAVSKTSETQCTTNTWERQKMVGGADTGATRVENDILKTAGS